MRAESEEIMRVNGHNDQCTCVECASPNQTTIPVYAASASGPVEPMTEEVGVVRDDDQPDLRALLDAHRHDHAEVVIAGQRPLITPAWGVPEEVGIKRELPLNRHVLGSRIVGAVELDHVAPTGRIVAVVLDVDGAHWALWWDRTANALISRPLRSQVA